MLVEALDGATNSLQSWTQGMATVGKLASALPAVHTSPGSVLDFPDLLLKWFNNGTKHLVAATTDGDLTFGPETIDLGVGDGRSGTLQSHLQTLGNGDEQLDFTVDVTKTVHDQPLSVPLPIGGGPNAPQSAFSSTGGVDVSVHATLTFRAVLGPGLQHHLLRRRWGDDPQPPHRGHGHLRRQDRGQRRDRDPR